MTDNELEFWQKHREYVQHQYNENPTDNNLVWLKNVDARIYNAINSPKQKVVEKPQFGQLTNKKGK